MSSLTDRLALRRLAAHVDGGAQINAGHPLAAGLVRFLVPVGSQLVDLVSGQIMEAVGVAFSAEPTPKGDGVRNGVTNGSSYWQVPFSTETKENFSLLATGTWRGWHPSIVANNCVVHDSGYANTGGTLLGANRGTVSAPRIGARIGGTLVGSAPATDAVLNMQTTLALTCAASQAAVFENARLLTSGDLSAAPSALSGQWRVLRAGATAASPDFVLNCLLIWDRGLSPGDIALLDFDFRQLLTTEPDFSTLARVITAAGGATLAPADATSSHLADAPVLTASASLMLADGRSAHLADTAVLSVAGALAPAKGVHAHSADAATLVRIVTLVANDGAHALMSDAALLVLPSQSGSRIWPVPARNEAASVPTDQRQTRIDLS